MFYVLSVNKCLCGAVLVVEMRIRKQSEAATAVNLARLSASLDQSHPSSLH